MVTGANQYSGTTTVQSGLLRVDGSIVGSAVTVESAGILGGVGSVGALTVQSGGVLAPGAGLGSLATGSLSLQGGSKLTAELGGAATGSGYDQVKVTGAVALSGELDLTRVSGFKPVTGSTYRLIDNDGDDAVTGTFSAVVTGKLGSFAVDYAGGDGNDVVVTALADAPVIKSNGGGASGTLSVHENTTAVTTVVASNPDGGDALSFAIVDGPDASKFSINSTTGKLAFKSTPDFEHPTDTGHNNHYSVTVNVSDGSSFSDTQTLDVGVGDLAGASISATSHDDKIDSGHPLNGKTPGSEEDVLRGKGGDDTIRGYGGADTITGGKGADKLYAGSDADTDVFVFHSAHDSGTKSEAEDRIYQFDRKNGHEAGSDKIDLSDLHVTWSDIDLDTSGPNVRVSVDAHGSDKADMVILVMNIDTLHKSDFVL